MQFQGKLQKGLRDVWHSHCNLQRKKKIAWHCAMKCALPNVSNIVSNAEQVRCSLQCNALQVARTISHERSLKCPLSFWQFFRGWYVAGICWAGGRVAGCGSTTCAGWLPRYVCAARLVPSPPVCPFEATLDDAATSTFVWLPVLTLQQLGCVANVSGRNKEQCVVVSSSFAWIWALATNSRASNIEKTSHSSSLRYADYPTRK